MDKIDYIIRNKLNEVIIKEPKDWVQKCDILNETTGYSTTWTNPINEDIYLRGIGLRLNETGHEACYFRVLNSLSETIFFGDLVRYLYTSGWDTGFYEFKESIVLEPEGKVIVNFPLIRERSVYISYKY